MNERPSTDYDARLEAEQDDYAEREVVHDLPPIFHYWSNRYIRPMFEGFGFSNPDELFALAFQRAHADSPSRPSRFVSLGSGNCDTEIRLAQLLLDRGISDFTLECLDVNDSMLERGRTAAREASLADRVLPVRADLNSWKPDGLYDGVMVNQSLHHMLALEEVFDAVDAALPPHGRFVTSDMIGRNGHLRWPEALVIVREFWQELPDHYRFHTLLRRQETEFEDWDCSQKSFEGIRSQDILPLLLERFDFELFVGFANVIDPFVDRGFGPHFRADAEWDTGFIDRVHARDEREIAAGAITPTHMAAMLRKRPFDGETQHRDHLTPEFCVRRP
jgi:SAM-dependent methyltransferase